MAQAVHDPVIQGRKPRLVSVGRHLLPRLAPADFIALGERRWHSLHTRAQEMLEDARADSAQRVATLDAIYAKRDRTASLAVEFAATLDGAIEVLGFALARAKIDEAGAAETVESMTPEAVIEAAVGLLGVDLREPSDPK